MKFLRTLTLFACAVGLLTLAGFVLGSSPLAIPAAIAGISSVGLALV
jgi:hypothetical protein